MDWIAGLCELIGLWIMGDKNRRCFVFFAGGNIVWTYIAFTRPNMWGLLLVTIPAIIMNIRAFVKWGK